SRQTAGTSVSDLSVALVKTMVHVLRGPRAAGFSDNARRHSGHGGVRRHRFEHDRAGADTAVLSDLDVAQHLGAHREQHTATDLGMTVLVFFPGSSQS